MPRTPTYLSPKQYSENGVKAAQTKAKNKARLAAIRPPSVAEIIAGNQASGKTVERRKADNLIRVKAEIAQDNKVRAERRKK